jgi:hypothetical protein
MTVAAALQIPSPAELFQRVEASFVRQGLMQQTLMPVPKMY